MSQEQQGVQGQTVRADVSGQLAQRSATIKVGVRQRQGC